jgi:hypothetical protein
VLLTIAAALGPILLLLIKVWIDTEIKSHGWPGLARTLGNVGAVALTINCILITCLALISALYHLTQGLGPNPWFPLPRFAIWLEGFLIPTFLAYALFRLRKNVMLFLSSIMMWLTAALMVYSFVRSFPNNEIPRYLADTAEFTVGMSVAMAGILFVVAIASAAISSLYGVVDTADK